MEYLLIDVFGLHIVDAIVSLEELILLDLRCLELAILKVFKDLEEVTFVHMSFFVPFLIEDINDLRAFDVFLLLLVHQVGELLVQLGVSEVLSLHRELFAILVE